MKKVILFMLLMGAVWRAPAQSSQIKLYIQQIAANQVLIGYLQKGYQLAKTGLTAIGNIRNGEFNLHRDFFGSLKAINPKIKNSALVVDIIALQAKILKVYKSDYGHLKGSGAFTPAEINYFYSVFTKLLDGTTATLEELYTLVTADHYQLSDDERIKRLNALYVSMQSNYAFAQHFGKEAMVLAAQRSNEKNEVDWSKKIIGK